jgi:hypothetical protein
LLPNALCIFQLTRGIVCAWACAKAKPVATATAAVAVVNLAPVLTIMFPSSVGWSDPQASGRESVPRLPARSEEY